MSSDAATPQPDTPPPNEQADADDLDPQIEPEPHSDDQPEQADSSDPAAVNTLINPENS